MSNTLSGDLPALWRARAETLSTYGDPNSARLWNIAATELERAMESSAAETLTVAEASRICPGWGLETARACDCSERWLRPSHPLTSFH